MRMYQYLLLGVFSFTLLGCGGSSSLMSEDLVPVSGTVKLNGRPAEGLHLTFYPTGETKTLGGCWAVTDEHGKYVVTHPSKQEGIPAGAYFVTFSRFVKSDGSPLGPNQSPTTTAVTESVDPKWSDLSKAKSHNKVVVPEAGADKLDFNISTAPSKK